MKMYIETKKGYKAGDPPSNFAGNHLVLPEDSQNTVNIRK